MSTHRHSWIRVGSPPDEPWDGNVYFACSCGKTKPYPCGRNFTRLTESYRCALPIGHDGNHRSNGYEWIASAGW